MNPAKVTLGFIQNHSRPSTERRWLKEAFSIMMRVARRNKQFSMDDIWAELDKAYEKGTLPDIDIDHRVLGPMLRHLVKEGLIDSTGYYVKSIRTGGGSRPITVWTSHIYQGGRVAA
jgi:hypothetical protein